jgi:Zn-dependent protease
LVDLNAVSSSLSLILQHPILHPQAAVSTLLLRAHTTWAFIIGNPGSIIIRDNGARSRMSVPWLTITVAFLIGHGLVFHPLPHWKVGALYFIPLADILPHL